MQVFIDTTGAWYGAVACLLLTAAYVWSFILATVQFHVAI